VSFRRRRRNEKEPSPRDPPRVDGGLGQWQPAFCPGLLLPAGNFTTHLGRLDVWRRKADVGLSIWAEVTAIATAYQTCGAGRTEDDVRMCRQTGRARLIRPSVASAAVNLGEGSQGSR